MKFCADFGAEDADRLMPFKLISPLGKMSSGQKGHARGSDKLKDALILPLKASSGLLLSARMLKTPIPFVDNKSFLSVRKL